MCFSITASFTASAILIPMGLYAITYASKHRDKFILLAAIPLFFGIQQFTEGLVWYGLHHGYDGLIHSASLVYLFFAYFWWPFFIPLSTRFLEQNPRQKKILFYFCVSGFILGLSLYLAVVFDVIHLQTFIINHSIEYETSQREPLAYLFVIIYVSIVTLSFFLSSIKQLKYLGLVVLLAFIVATIWYYFTFTSVWCFFAALISAYVIYIVRVTK